MKKLFLHSFLLASVVYFAACNRPKDVPVPGTKDSLVSHYGNPGPGIKDIKDSLKNQYSKNGSPDTVVPYSCNAVVDLMAGQHTVAGNITVNSDADNLYVTYNTIGGWVLKETHLYIGNIKNIPTGNGNFPYTDSNLNNLTSFTYTIPLNELSGDSCFAIATHASVRRLDSNGNEVQGETAWSKGNKIPGRSNWSMYFDYCLCGNNGGGANTGGDTGGNTGGGIIIGG